jgi:lipoyl-dependent peroxiredoxin
MPTRKASAVWEGDIQGGSGSFEGESGAVSGRYTAGSRFAEDPGTNPEELLAAAEASCFSMALSVALGKQGATPERIRTEAACTVEKQGDGFAITTMRLRVRAKAQGVDDETFQSLVQATRKGCPVSRALAGVDIQVEAELER